MNNVNIIMITLNYKDYEGCKNICNQVMGSSVVDALVIVDNLSNDGSYEKLLSEENNKIHITSSGENLGYSSGYNFGFLYALNKYKPTYMILCNSDVLFDDKFLASCLDYMRINAKCGAVSGTMRNPIGEVLTSAWNYPSYKDDLLYYFPLFRNKILKNKTQLSKDILASDAPSEVDSLAGSFTFFRTEALLKCDFYDDGVFLYNEENIIGKRLRNAGYQLVLLPNISYIHNHKKKRGTGTSYKLIMKSTDSVSYMHQKYTHITNIQSAVLFLARAHYAIEITIKNKIKSFFRTI